MSAAPTSTTTAAPASLRSDRLRAPHGFFTRAGGVSSGLYASLQCGFGATSDARENVVENRARVARALGLAPDRLVTGYQAHTPRAIVVEGPWAPADAPEADALVTDRPGLALGVLSADCAPVLFEDAEAGVIGAAHAGWRGALDGVLEATLAAMAGLGARLGRIRAAIGPTIGPASYQIGPEFEARFLAADPANRRFFGHPDAEGRTLFDLPAFVIAKLHAARIADAVWVGVDTYRDARCFSHRRAMHAGEPDYGRMLSAIRLPEPGDPR